MNADIKTRLADAIYGELDIEDGDRYGGYGTPAVHEIKLTGLDAAVEAALVVLREAGLILPAVPAGWVIELSPCQESDDAGNVTREYYLATASHEDGRVIDRDDPDPYTALTAALTAAANGERR